MEIITTLKVHCPRSWEIKWNKNLTPRLSYVLYIYRERFKWSEMLNPSTNGLWEYWETSNININLVQRNILMRTSTFIERIFKVSQMYVLTYVYMYSHKIPFLLVPKKMAGVLYPCDTQSKEPPLNIF